MKELHELSKTEYKQLEGTGMIAELFPEYTGDWWEDAGKYQQDKNYVSTQDQMITELEEVYNSLGEFIRRWK